jgi:hypothetical protein
MSRRFEKPFAAWPAAIALSAMALALQGCLHEDTGPGTLAGTSTSVGTSIGGTAMYSDGSLAAGARIRVRADTVVFENGIPRSPVLDSTRADAQGRFKIRAPKPWTFHLEIEASEYDAGVSLMPTGASEHAPEVYAATLYGAPAKGELGDLHLAKPGSLSGSVEDSTASEGKVWIGIPGTGWIVEAVYVAAAGGGKAGAKPAEPRRRGFRLDGIFPGEYRLQVIRPESDTGLNLQLKLTPLRVESGSVTDAGVIRF